MEVKLVVVGGKHSGQVVPVPHCKFLIGRAEDCHLRAASDLISRHHAVILVEEAFVAVRDFASRNGTFVNGQRIQKEQELKTGDHLKVGPLEFEVRLDVPVAGKKKPKVHSVQEAAARTVENVQSTPDDEPDLGDWLDDDDDALASRETRTAESPVVDTTATVGPQIGDTTALSADASKPASEGEDDGGDSKADTGHGGTGHKVKKKATSFAQRLKEARTQPSVDSGSAADDVLRKFFGRKS